MLQYYINEQDYLIWREDNYFLSAKIADCGIIGPDLIKNDAITSVRQFVPQLVL